jgi:hypothetical protein
MSLGIVQSAAAASSAASAPAATLGAAPTNGNLLVAFTYSNSGVLTPGTGWMLIVTAINTGNTEYTAVWAKYAGASESATQTPNTASQPAWTCDIYEISGVSGVLTQDLAEAYAQYLGSGSSGTPTAFNNANANELILIAGHEASTSVSTLSISGGGTWTADANAQGTSNGFNQSTFIWHQAVSTSGNDIDPTISTNHSFRLYSGIAGVTSSPVTGTPNVVQETWGTASAATSVSATLAKAPASGHLLLATIQSDVSPSADTGWTQDDQASSGSQFITTFWKYAGASESATQTPCTFSSGIAICNLKEISGLTGVWTADHVATHIAQQPTSPLNSSYSPASFNTTLANELVATCTIAGASADNSLLSSTGITTGAWVNAGLEGTDFCGQSTAYLVPSSGTTIHPTLTPAENAWFASAQVELGLGSSSGSASGALGSNLTIGSMDASASGTQSVTASGALGSNLTIGAMMATAGVLNPMQMPKAVAYAIIGIDNAELMPKSVAYALIGVPNDTAPSVADAKSVAYAIIGPPPPRRPARVNVQWNR